MKVYRLRNDVNRYQYFLPVDNEDYTKLEGNCTPKAETWSPPPVFVYKPLHKAGDVYQFGSSVLITSPCATKVLRTHLEMAGELLPLPHQGQEYTLLNVTECINCLDQDKTEWVYGETTGARLYPKRYVFHRDRFAESALFKIPETYRGEILVVEGLHGLEEEFRYAVEQAGLKGFRFEELWADED